MTVTKLSDAEVTSRIRCAMRVKFEDRNRYVMLEEVANATGFGVRGWADAVVLQLWPSDGLALDGFEIKASRGDWKKELKDLRKSENIARFCDRWTVVALKGIVKREELPAPWGLWEYDPERDTLRTVAQPAVANRSKYLHRGFLAALLRRTQDTLPSEAYLARVVSAAADRVRRDIRRELDTSERKRTEAEIARDAMIRAMREAGWRKRSWGDPMGGPEWIAPTITHERAS